MERSSPETAFSVERLQKNTLPATHCLEWFLVKLEQKNSVTDLVIEEFLWRVKARYLTWCQDSQMRGRPRDPKALLRLSGNCRATPFGVATPYLRIPSCNGEHPYHMYTGTYGTHALACVVNTCGCTSGTLWKWNLVPSPSHNGVLLLQASSSLNVWPENIVYIDTQSVYITDCTS